MTVDVDLRVDDVAGADQHHQLGTRRRAAGQVVGDEAHVGDVEIALLGHRRAAHAGADADEDVVGGGAHERAQPQHVVGEQLVDAGPVEARVQLVRAAHGGLEHGLERRAGRHLLVELADEIVDAHEMPPRGMGRDPGAPMAGGGLRPRQGVPRSYREARAGA